ncbi:hypothetical protein WMY93_021542 [Mugilogobius chulae]|uniref:Apple domain-containing protein n=1 Tax=Mugilogobius chulae TaxID=88201 RepID=A0AAW0NFY6_9GOBI
MGPEGGRGARESLIKERVVKLLKSSSFQNDCGLNMKRLLVFVSVLCLYRLSSGQECRRELLEDVDFPGSDITSVYSPDVYHCQQMCTQHAACQFFTFLRDDWARDGRNFYCYLKRTDSGEPAVTVALKGLTSGYSLRPCNDRSAPCFNQRYANRDFPGADYKSLFTADYAECQQACTQDHGCQFFTWINRLYPNENIRFKCHLKFSWTIPLPPNVDEKTGVVSGFSSHAQISTRPSVDNKCHTNHFANSDIPGHDLLKTPAGSPEHCQALCSAHPSCTYFSFASSTCYLKENANKMVTTKKAGVTSGLPSRFCQQPKNWLTVTHEGTDFQGSDMRYVKLDDPRKCQAACNSDPYCQFFTYVTKQFRSSEYW